MHLGVERKPAFISRASRKAVTWSTRCCACSSASAKGVSSSGKATSGGTERARTCKSESHTAIEYIQLEITVLEVKDVRWSFFERATLMEIGLISKPAKVERRFNPESKQSKGLLGHMSQMWILNS